MRKKTFLIPVFTLIVAMVLLGAITLANSTQNIASQPAESQAIESQPAFELSEISAQSLDAQVQIVYAAIDQGEQAKADAAFGQLIAQFANSNGLDKAIYEIGKDYQYSTWNTEKANEAHNYNIENFPDTQYGMLSNVEIIRSYLRSGNKTADTEVEIWMNKYKGRPDQVIGIYLIAQAYSGNKKADKALELFKYAAENYPDNLYGTLSQVRYDAATKNYETADVAADYLVASSYDNEYVKQGIRDLANFYRDNKEYERAIHFYQAEIETWSEYDDPVDPYREMIYCYIDMNDADNTRLLIAEIQQVLADNPKLARTNFDIANYFLAAGDSANAVRLHEYNVENYTESLESLWSQAALVWFYVRQGDEENAYIEYAEMLSIYENEETLPKEVFQIGDIYVEVDNTEKARSLYQQVLDEWPESEYVFNAEAGFIKADIHDGYDETAMNGIDTLMEKYKDNSQLPRTLLTFGEEYYNKGCKVTIGKFPPGSNLNPIQGEDKQEFTNKFENSLNVWLMAIEALETETIKADYSISAEYYHYAGTCNRLLGNYDKALEYYHKVIDSWPDYEAVGCVAGLIPNVYERMQKKGLISGDSAEKLIIDSYKLIVEKYPDSPALKAAISKIKRYEQEINSDLKEMEDFLKSQNLEGGQQ